MDSVTASLGKFLPETLHFLIGPAVALIVILVGYIISKILASLVAGGINRTGLGKKAQTTGGNIGKSISKAVFWVLWLVFILMGLSQFPLVSDALEPIKGMLNSCLLYTSPSPRDQRGSRMPSSA